MVAVVFAEDGLDVTQQHHTDAGCLPPGIRDIRDSRGARGLRPVPAGEFADGQEGFPHVGVAVLDTVKEVSGVEAALKWPNDVLAGDGKLAGILCEAVGDAVVVGIGLNVTLRGDEVGEPGVTSLADLGVGDLDRTRLAVELLRRARDLGLDPYGVSFHVGSQQTDLGQWDGAVGSAAQMFSLLAEADIELRMVNIGGGFPAHYRSDVPAIDGYARAVMAAITRHFGNQLPEILIEPGRSLVGDAGIIQTEVVLISEKGCGDSRRWVYLDVGKFNGLAETMDESIKYRIATPGRSGVSGPVILAGPTCDSADILYERTEYRLPLGLEVGDKVEIRPMMYVALSYDHRIVDGREAVTFLVRIKECVEDPSRILFEM